MIQSHTRIVPWLSIVHLPHTATIRWLPSRSTTHNNIARIPWLDINARWRTVKAVLQIRSGTRVTRSMESLPNSWILLAHRRWCNENHKPPLLFTLRGSAHFTFRYQVSSSFWLRVLSRLYIWIPLFAFNETRFCPYIANALILLGYHHMTRLKVPSIYILTLWFINVSTRLLRILYRTASSGYTFPISYCIVAT